MSALSAKMTFNSIDALIPAYRLLFFLALSEKLRSNLSQASWAAFVPLGIVSTIIKYVCEIKIDAAAKPPNLRMLHVAGSCNNKQK